MELTCEEDIDCNEDLNIGTENVGNSSHDKEEKLDIVNDNQESVCPEGQDECRTPNMPDGTFDEISLSSLNNRVETDEVVGWKITLAQCENNMRHYTMTVEMLDPETEEHPVPCSCPRPQCLIISKMLEKEEMENEDTDSS
ncbi:hypothetical protein OTU49_004336 [Cherax quadricarinatus]|uniref:Uncharacterized protein n=1 Tax=Cherax quadricarinatus TaxID=27406 RepID=A0AAW0XE22_CHEQU